jgi:hypothetical protein
MKITALIAALLWLAFIIFLASINPYMAFLIFLPLLKYMDR